MMKATGLKRGSRKKQQQQPQAIPQKQPPPPPPPSSASPRENRERALQQQHTTAQYGQHQSHHNLPQQEQQHNMRRSNSQRSVPLPDHVELTKKNYRLAKELGELRVRHREECKNVTRLTMENMNLASRCREAISHVAVLKKELVTHQKRAQDALKFQREQTQRLALNLSAEVSRLSTEESPTSTPERNMAMERILATPPPPPPPPKDSHTVIDSPQQKQQQIVRTVSPSEKAKGVEAASTASTTSSEDEDDTVHSDSRQGRSVLEVVESLSNGSPPKRPPRMYSTPNRHRKEDRWTPHIHDAPGSSEKETLFPHSASPKVIGKDEEFPADIMPTSSSSSHFRGHIIEPSSDVMDDEDIDEDFRPSPTLLDRHSGFITMNSIDAFEASFDRTFPSDFPTSRKSPASETYNPFDASPGRNLERSSQQVSNAVAQDPFPNDKGFSTPPKDRLHVEPDRPHKTPSTEARARYENALQPRSSANSNEISTFEKAGSGFLRGSPSKLLKRMQGKRKDGQESPSESSKKEENVSPSKKATPDSSSTTNRSNTLEAPDASKSAIATKSPGDFNARPGGMVARLQSLKQRRSVKQPVSYAEPALNTKIRKGHSYFPKEPNTVTPEGV